MKKLLLPLTLIMSLGSIAAFAGQDNNALKLQITKLKEKVAMFEAKEALEAKNIALYDKMDLVAFTQHDMKTIQKIHSDDVLVYNPDGSLTQGMDKHTNEMQWLFDTFPDIEINKHPIKFGSDNWTAGMSVTTGTFSAPMKLQNGTVIPPTGKKFSIRIVTLVRWENGRIAEEYLFWDNADWNKQIGLGK